LAFGFADALAIGGDNINKYILLIGMPLARSRFSVSKREILGKE
jgi:hypothetical protein